MSQQENDFPIGIQNASSLIDSLDSRAPDLFDSLTPDQQEQLSEIMERYLAGLEQGDQQDPDELIRQYPKLASAIGHYMASIDFLHGASRNLDEGHPQNVINGDTKQLGDFEIVREVGRGGMGVVYEANQRSLGRRVALKVLPFAAVLDQRQIARFKNEAHAAAQLHHPNIVPVHSVGCDRGVHYYSMQFIEGQSLDFAIAELKSRSTDAVAQHVSPNDSTKAKVSFSTQRSVRSANHIDAVTRLVMQAARALSHAHEFGVVHRDIKPSNLMIDEGGKLWVTDFGLARCNTSSNITLSGDLLGTLRYMSPEQAQGRGNLVDHRSDVYSLAVTFYELLTLQPPHTASDRQELLDQILNQTATSPRRLNPSIPIDLETILQTAMSKSRDDRYESASDFADDLARFLEGETPHARRPSLIDRGARWAVGHRTLVGSIAAALLLVATVASAALMMVSSEKRKTEAALVLARQNYDQSQENLGKAIEVVDRFGLRVAKRLAQIPGAESVRQNILEETLEDYQRFADQLETENSEDASVPFALALCHGQIASMQQQLGQLPEAIENFQSSIKKYELVQKSLTKEAPSQTPALRKRVRHDMAVMRNNLGKLQFALGKLEFAEANYAKSESLARRLLDQSTSTEENNELPLHVLTATLINQGNLKRSIGQNDQARRIYEEAAELQQQLCGFDPDDLVYQRELAVIFAQLSFLNAADDLPKADQFNQQAISIHQSIVDKHPDDLQAISELTACYNHRGGIFRQRNQMEAATLAYRDAIELQTQLVQRSPRVVRFQEQLAVAHNNLGQMLVGQPEFLADAQQHFEQAERGLAKLVQTVPDSPHYTAQWGGVLANLAPLIEATDPDAARQNYQQAIEHQRESLKHAPSVVQFRLWLSSTYVKYGRFLRRDGKPEMAAEVAVQRRGLWPDQPERLYRIAIEIAAAASDLAEANDPQADQWIREAVVTWNQATNAGLPQADQKQQHPAFDILRGHQGFDFAESESTTPKVAS